MNALFPCPTCARHVRRVELACPFCGSDVAEAARVAPVRRHLQTRARRAASYVLGASLSAAGCSTSTTIPDSGAPLDAGPVDAPMFADAAAYGAPDAPLDPVDAAPGVDAGESDPDAGVDAGSDIALYGSPSP